MNARNRAAVRLACAAAVLALAAPMRLAAQTQPQAPAAAAEAIKDLPLTAEQRQAYVGNYEASLPDGQQPNPGACSTRATTCSSPRACPAS